VIQHRTSKGLLFVSWTLVLSLAVACATAKSGGDRTIEAGATESSCNELRLPVVVSAERVSQLEGCRLAVAALLTLLRDSDAAMALAGLPLSPTRFDVRRAPYLPVGTDLPASERIVVTIRLEQNRWDADVWFADSLTPLAVHLSHKPM
jgi:hypothetical protein